MRSGAQGADSHRAPAPGTAAYKGLPPSSLEKLGDERLAMGKYLPAADAYQAALKQNPAPRWPAVCA